MNPALSIALGVLLALGGNLLLARPAWEKYQESQSELQTVTTKVNGAQARIDQLPVLRNQQAQAEAHLSEIQVEFPAEENLASLIGHLQDTAANDHLQVSSITRTTQLSVIPGFQEVRLTINADGTYPHLYQYLKDLRGQKRLLNVTGVTSSNNKHTVNVTGYTRH